MAAKKLRTDFFTSAFISGIIERREREKTVRAEEVAQYDASNVNAFNLHSELAGIAKGLKAETPQRWEYRKPYAREKDFPPGITDRWSIQADADSLHSVIMGPQPVVIAIPVQKTPFSFFDNTVQRLTLAFEASAHGSDDPLFDLMHVLRFRGTVENGQKNDELLCVRRGEQNLRFGDMRQQYTDLLRGNKETVLLPPDMRPLR